MSQPTARQRIVLAAVVRHQLRGSVRWYRAADNGERVTLAALYRHGVLVRRCHRGQEGEANAAHEYRVGERIMSELRKVWAERHVGPSMENESPTCTQILVVCPECSGGDPGCDTCSGAGAISDPHDAEVEEAS